MDNDLRGQIDALNRQAWAIFRHDPPRAQALSQAALAQASQAQPPYLQGVLESRRTLSQVCVGRGDYPQALAHAEAGMQLVAAEALDAAPTAVRHAWLMAAHGRAMALNYLQGAQDSLVQLYENLALAERLGDTLAQAVALNGIASDRHHLGELDEARALYARCLALLQSLDEPFWEALARYNVGALCEDRQEYAEGLQYVLQALQLAELHDFQRIRATALYQAGLLYWRLAQVNAARDYLQQAIDLAQQLERREIVVVALLALGSLENAQQQPDAALPPLQAALALAEEIGFLRPQYESHEALALAYRQNGDWQAALGHFEQFYRLRTRVFDEEKSRQLAEMQAKHEAAQLRQEAEIQQLRNVELARKNAQLEALHREKDEMLAIVAHDLRTPVSAIMLAGDGLEMLLADEPAARQRRYLQRIQVAATAMNDIIQRLLLTNRIESGRIEVRPARLAVSQLLHDLLLRHEAAALAKGIRPRLAPVPPELVIETDAGLLREVLDNLMSNAVKYSPADTVVTLAADTAAAPTAVQLSVADQGPGLTEADRARLFEKYARLSARPTAGESSNGLGLYVARRLVGVLNGRIWAESEGPGMGSRFVVELPYSAG